MQTHYDNNHQSAFIDALRERAAKADNAAASVITAGEKDEQELGAWEASNGVHCRHLPDDPQGILRLSIGGGEHLPVPMNYVVVRGKIGQCIELLEKLSLRCESVRSKSTERPRSPGRRQTA